MSDELNTQTLELLKQLSENMQKTSVSVNEMADKVKGLFNENLEKTPANVHTGIRLHGSSGVFAGPGLERDVLTAHVRPYGVESVLPMIPSVSEDPRFAALTGFTAAIGNQPASACLDAPYGYLKGCNLTARFGRARFDTNTVEMDRVMLQVNRGDFTDLVLRGKLLGMTDLVPSGLNYNQVLDIITMAEMVTVGVLTERYLNTQIWQGSALVANQFPGLDVQIATGQEDADTGVACPALDSDVKNYGYNLLSATIVQYLSSMMWYLQYNAATMGLDPVNWVIVMRPDLWYELTAIWPCAYNTDRCGSAQTAGSSTVMIDGRENVAERDAMRNGMYLYANGVKYPVIVDTGIFEHNNANNANCAAGEYASTIYALPLTVSGGMPVTYREYVDYRRAAPDVNLLNGLEQFFWTDNGVFSWALEQVKWCYKLSLKTEQRVVLRAPHLAGRIDAVKYRPTQHLRDSDPSSSYFKDGGVSLRSAIGTPHAVWSGR